MSRAMAGGRSGTATDMVDFDDPSPASVTTTTVAPSSLLTDKAAQIEALLARPVVDLWALRALALSPGGLLRDDLRRRAWPLLLGLSEASSSFSLRHSSRHTPGAGSTNRGDHGNTTDDASNSVAAATNEQPDERPDRNELVTTTQHRGRSSPQQTPREGLPPRPPSSRSGSALRAPSPQPSPSTTKRRRRPRSSSPRQHVVGGAHPGRPPRPPSSTTVSPVMTTITRRENVVDASSTDFVVIVNDHDPRRETDSNGDLQVDDAECSLALDRDDLDFDSHLDEDDDDGESSLASSSQSSTFSNGRDSNARCPTGKRRRRHRSRSRTHTADMTPSSPLVSSSSDLLLETSETSRGSRRNRRRPRAGGKPHTTLPVSQQSRDHAQIDRDVTRCTWHLLTGNQRLQRLQMEHKKQRNRRVLKLIANKQRRLGRLIDATLARSYEMEAELGDHHHLDRANSPTGVDAVVHQHSALVETLDDFSLFTLPSQFWGSPATQLTHDPPPQTLRYYQGYHDVACIFLSTLGGASSEGILSPADIHPSHHDSRNDAYAEIVGPGQGFELASAALYHLSQSHFRDCLKDDFTQLQTMLQLTVFPLLAILDHDVHNHLWDAGMEPFFCLSWVITWFAHDIRDTALVKRLFDVFLVSHPLFPVYVAVAMVLHPVNRAEILATECDFAELHQLLSGLPKSSSSVGWKYLPGDGYVSDHDDPADGTVSTGDDLSFIQLDGEFLIVSGGGGDGVTRSHNPMGRSPVKGTLSNHLDFPPSEVPSMVSTSLGSAGIEPAARVPFQELIDTAVQYMQQYPPRELWLLAERYCGVEKLTAMVAKAPDIRSMQAPPMWSVSPAIMADWVLRDRYREEKRTSTAVASIGNAPLERKRECSRSSSRMPPNHLPVSTATSEENGIKTGALTTGAIANGAIDADTSCDDFKEYIGRNSSSIPVVALGFGSRDDDDDNERRERQNILRLKRRRRRRLLVAGAVGAMVVAVAVGAVQQYQRVEVQHKDSSKNPPATPSTSLQTSTSGIAANIPRKPFVSESHFQQSASPSSKIDSSFVSVLDGVVSTMTQDETRTVTTEMTLSKHPVASGIITPLSPTLPVRELRLRENLPSQCPRNGPASPSLELTSTSAPHFQRQQHSAAQVLAQIHELVDVARRLLEHHVRSAWAATSLRARTIFGQVRGSSLRFIRDHLMEEEF